jgi:protein ImuA
MQVKSAKLETLREEVARIERGSSRVATERFSIGEPEIDGALRGGLVRGGVHEVFAETVADQPCAVAFAVALAVRASGVRPVVWVRQDFVSVEMGELYAPGVAELGLSPDRLILVRARDGPAVLRAAEEAVRCAPLGAVIAEPWGAPKALDLVASRRLALAAAQSGVSLLMVRAAAQEAPSAATTRWSVRAAMSRALDADAPGRPSYAITLVRDRAGGTENRWLVEWDRDSHTFTNIPRVRVKALSGGMVSLPAGGQAHPEERRAG